jgi:hypothetical protein
MTTVARAKPPERTRAVRPATACNAAGIAVIGEER